MILKTINEKCKNKRAAIQFLCANMDNGVVYNECTKLLNNQPLRTHKMPKGYVYQYRNYDNTQTCSIERTKADKGFIYTVAVCIRLNIN